jgi:3-dehydroquinate synthase
MNLQVDTYEIVFDQPLESLVNFVQTNYATSRKFVLTDTNCLNLVIPAIEPFLAQLQVEPQVLTINPGEESKSLDMAYELWENFTDLEISRSDVLLCLGGGVVSDLGGFVASAYKRGIDVINIPTTLLAMADASVGGKVGINFHQLKNHIGYFSNPKAVFVHTEFLQTLPEREFISGYAEMMKHALIANAEMWKRMVKEEKPSIGFIHEILPNSVAIKSQIVQRDPNDRGERKILNFGHTIGHAIETLFMDSDTQVLHGEAVAAGMICAAYISHKQIGLAASELEEISHTILKVFDLNFVAWLLAENLALPLKHDKKNRQKSLRFVLISEIGKPVYDQDVSMELALESFEYLQSLLPEAE